MGIITTMMVDYGDFVYQYTPRYYSVEVRDGNRLLAGGPRINTYDMEYFRLDLRHWEVEKRETGSDTDSKWQTLHFRKRQREEVTVIKDSLTDSTQAYTAYGYEEVDGKYYIFSDSAETDVIDEAEWTMRKISLFFPGYSKQTLIFTKKETK